MSAPLTRDKTKAAPTAEAPDYAAEAKRLVDSAGDLDATIPIPRRLLASLFLEHELARGMLLAEKHARILAEAARDQRGLLLDFCAQTFEVIADPASLPSDRCAIAKKAAESIRSIREGGLSS